MTNKNLKDALQESENITVTLDSTEPLKVEIVECEQCLSKEVEKGRISQERYEQCKEIECRSIIAKFFGMKKDTKCTKILTKVVFGLLLVIGISILVRQGIANIWNYNQIIKAVTTPK